MSLSGAGAKSRCSEEVQRAGAASRCREQVQTTGAASRCREQVQTTGAASRCNEQVSRAGADSRCREQVSQAGAARRDWIKRHRRSLIITVSIFGGGYVCYQTVKAFQKRVLIEKDEYEARAFIMHQERIEAQLQVHFQSIQRISDSTTLPSILLRLKSQILSLLDLSRLTEELEQDKDNSRLSAQERTELWENIKTISFSRATCCMWALTIAVLFVRVQFNILARHVYLATARDISNVEQLGVPLLDC
ncbi:hypothetical protein L7F22_011408 [Adiantum nelumboides]|nr:hypothetical protein [Adiantum nelumboides]